jgi:phage major head subunit gpT-like protein
VAKVKITPLLLAGIFTGYSAAYARGFSMAKSQRSIIATTVPSSTSKNDYGWLGQFPGMREWIGERVIQRMKAHGYSITNKKWEQTIAVDVDTIEDDEYGVFTPMFEEMGRATEAHPDELCWGLLKDGFNQPCYDGQSFFDTDHPVLDANGNEQSVSNFGGGAATPWYLIDDTRALKPIIFQERLKPNFAQLNKPTDPNVFMQDEYIYGVKARHNVGFGFWQFAYGSKQTLEADSFKAARAALSEMKGDYGRPLGIQGTTLIVPPSLEEAGLEILNADRNAAGATNVWRGKAKLEVVPWLA